METSSVMPQNRQLFLLLTAQSRAVCRAGAPGVARTGHHVSRCPSWDPWDVLAGSRGSSSPADVWAAGYVPGTALLRSRLYKSSELPSDGDTWLFSHRHGHRAHSWEWWWWGV